MRVRWCYSVNDFMLRVATVPECKPQSFTILGWEVPDIEKGPPGERQNGRKGDGNKRDRMSILHILR
jgi:hypothetical protein